MFYHAVHVRHRTSGLAAVLVLGFASEPGHPPENVSAEWRKQSEDPRVGERFTELHLLMDNRLVQSFDLPHPDKAAADQEKLAAARDEQARKTRAEEARKLIARLEQLESEGLTAEDVGLAGAEKAQRLAEEAEAKRTAELNSAPQPEPPASGPSDPNESPTPATGTGTDGAEVPAVAPAPAPSPPAEPAHDGPRPSRLKKPQ